MRWSSTSSPSTSTSSFSSSSSWSCAFSLAWMVVSEPVDTSLARISVSVIGLDCAGVYLLALAAHLGLLHYRSGTGGRNYGFRLNTLWPLRRAATGSEIAPDWAMRCLFLQLRSKGHMWDNTINESGKSLRYAFYDSTIPLCLRSHTLEMLVVRI